MTKLSDKYLYIQPRLKSGSKEQAGSNYDNIFDLDDQDERASSFNELFNSDFSIVLAEPGDGKSRLLKEIIKKSIDNGKKALFLDLKRVTSEGDLVTKINDFAQRPIKRLSTNKEINDIKDYCASENFSIDSESQDITICLDALDEVNKNNAYEIIEKIKQLKFSYPKVKLIVSCRDYIYSSNYDLLFNDLNPQILRVEAFRIDDVSRYLTEYGFSEDEITKVTERFYRHFTLETIKNPRVIEIFVAIKEKRSLEFALEQSKADLLEQFIYAELGEEDKKLNSNNKDVTKRVLEKLALTMEIYQVNEISKNDLMTFFDDINSGISSSFLQQISMNEFYERSLLIPSANGDSMQFVNAEFQEYLAAKEITRMGKFDQVTFDLVVDKRLNILKPSWVNTIRYLLELAPEIQKQIIQFICRNENETDLNFLEKILLSDKSKINQLPIDDRIEAFNLIFEKHNDLNWHLNYLSVEKISEYCSDSIFKMLEESVKSDIKETTIVNTIAIVRRLLQTDSLINKNVWRDFIVKKIENRDNTTNLRERAIKALAEFKDIELLRSTITIELETEDIIKHAYLSSCVEIDPNNHYTIDQMVNSLVANESYMHSIHSDFDRINTKDGVVHLLSRLLSLNTFDREYQIDTLNTQTLQGIAKNIERVYDNKIKEQLTQMLVHTKSGIKNHRFPPLLLDILIRKEKENVFYFIENLPEDSPYSQNWYLYNEIFEKAVSSKNAKAFIKKMLKKENRPGLVNLFIRYRNSKGVKEKELYNISLSSFKKDYDELDRQHREYEKKWDRTDSIYEDFKIKLEPAPKQFITDVFKYYLANEKTINKRITETDLLRLKKLLTDTVLLYNFSEVKVTHLKVGENNMQYSLSQSVSIFGDAIPLFDKFDLDHKLVRKKLIEYFPFAYQYDSTKNIYDRLGDLTKEEITQLVNFYLKKRNDDLYFVFIRNLFNVAIRYKILAAIPILKAIVFNKKYEIQVRKEAIEAIHSIQPDYNLYKEIFDKYSKKGSENQIELSYRANEYLIAVRNSYQEEAIKWRISKVIATPIEYSNPRISIHEIEYRTNNFNRPLMEVSDIRFKSAYLGLLEQAMRIWENGERFESYAVYLWSIALTYFDNLKALGSFAPLQELEGQIQKMSGRSGYNQLKSRFNGVQMNYATTLGKPASYAECIALYNQLKDYTYSSVSTATEFYYIINDIIDVDIRKWVEDEGAYSVINKNRIREDLIQKTIKTQFENALLKRGFRASEIKIRREEQLLDDKRTDFVISHGFIGQVLIEIKLAKNGDVKDRKYPSKLMNYISGTQSDYGVFLIFQTDRITKWANLEKRVNKMYEPHREKIKVIGLDCTFEKN